MRYSQKIRYIPIMGGKCRLRNESIWERRSLLFLGYSLVDPAGMRYGKGKNFDRNP